jgi:hypothetical protein
MARQSCDSGRKTELFRAVRTRSRTFEITGCQVHGNGEDGGE